MPGKSDAVCPSGTIPNNVRSKRGNSPSFSLKKEDSDWLYANAAFNGSPNSPITRKIREGLTDTFEENRSDADALISCRAGENIVLTAALTGLRKGEIHGLCWGDFDGREQSVKRSFWNSTVNDPKTNRSKAPIPVVKQLADALEAPRPRLGKLAQPSLPIFQAGNGKPLNLDNLVGV